MEKTYAFAGASYDPARGELAAQGRITRLRPQAGAVLVHLLDRPREIVSKDDLLREVWPNLVVTENSLVQCVREIRKELGDEEGAIVRTIPRRGYVLEADVSFATARPDGPLPARRLSLMVLPLANVGGDPEQAYFADALTDDLTTDLGRIPEAHVLSRSTALAYRDRSKDVRAIRNEIGVRYVVEGSVKRRGDEVVVNLGLMETESGTLVWSDRFAGARANLEDVQQAMAGQLANKLGREVLRAEYERIDGRPASCLDASDLAMRAWSLWQHNDPIKNAEAKRLARQALVLDPDCVRGLVTLAHACITEIVLRTTNDWEATLAEGETAARRAAMLQPHHPMVNAPLGCLLTYRGRFEEALGVLEAQVTADASFPFGHIWIGITNILMGRPALAIAPLQRAIALSPRAPALSTLYRNIAVAYFHDGNDEEALAYSERSIRLPNPWARSYETMAAVYGTVGLVDDGRAAVQKLLERWPGYSIAQHRKEMISNRPAFLAQRERYLQGLRAAGLPES
jgi:TolB-like protein